jgi:hypothetical protein
VQRLSQKYIFFKNRTRIIRQKDGGQVRQKDGGQVRQQAADKIGFKRIGADF